MTVSPWSSYCGLPALPAICLYSRTEISAFPPRSASYLVMSATTTLLAGRFTPAARVGVAARSLSALAL